LKKEHNFDGLADWVSKNAMYKVDDEEDINNFVANLFVISRIYLM
jgi:hypothetical protein